ncbi:MAG: YfbK domain-containing protein [Christensenellales bacterium]|jgi:Ca-activated chloride channel family protein
MKKAIRATATLLFALVVILLTACSSFKEMDAPAYYPYDTNQNEFDEIKENPFVLTSETPVSYFRLSVNTAAYSNLRRYIKNNYPIVPDQIKIEEIINYFKYDYPEPSQGALSIDAKFFSCPWNEEAQLLRVGLKAEEIDTSQIRNNLVFLLDVSGSMASSNKLGLMKQAFLLMLDNLNEGDVISIVTYAGSDKVLLDGGKGNEKARISGIIEDLSASGSTAGSKGIKTAYNLAAKHFIQGGNNRVILATDGDFNVGISTKSGLERFISQKRKTGVYLTALGFGYGNLKDNKLETLANKGNGNYAFIDTINEARKVLVEEIGGTLNTVARDAKARVEFNSAKVEKYRLLGYENLLLTQEEWEDTNTDAGEIGSGFTVTAVYEVVLKDSDAQSTMDDNYIKAAVRYKNADVSDTTEHEISVFASEEDIVAQPDEDMLFISALVEVSLVLRESQYKGTASIAAAAERVRSLSCINTDTYKAEFLELLNILLERQT